MPIKNIKQTHFICVFR